jgi:hypothetical protein
MNIQTEISWSHRAKLIEWVIATHGQSDRLPQTLFLAVNIIDRFLSVAYISLTKLVLLGATALFIASKHEESHYLTVGAIVNIVNREYTKQNIIDAERTILTKLKFEIGWPGPLPFLRRICKNPKTYNLALRLLESCLIDKQFLNYLPSNLALGAYCLALKKLHNELLVRFV